MGMTISQKILADHAGKESVEAGDLINVRVDMAMANDITAPISIPAFEKLGVKTVFDPKKVALVLSHYVPGKDILSATQAKTTRDFARKHGTLFFDEAHGGIEHALFPEEGLILPGDVYVGADSHTTTPGALCAFTCGMGSTDLAVAWATGEIWMKVPPTIRFIYHGKVGPWTRGKDLVLYTIGKIGTDGALYSSMQFEGEAISAMPMEQRLTMCNMVAEAGGKNGLMPFDRVTEEYVKPRAKRPWKVYTPDPDCQYSATYEWDVNGLDSQVAMPFSPGNVASASELASKNIEIDQVFIGSCTNGRISDMREAAAVLKGHKVAPWLRCIVIPATMKVYRQCLHEGLIDLFTDAGCVVSTPTCGPCLGGYMGVLAEGEKCVSTSNRNFHGRMGHPKAEVYLASASVAAASAVKGRVAHPSELSTPEAVQQAMAGKR